MEPRAQLPFIFSTEASLNLADDDELMQLMREAQFRYVFLGIESPDEETLIHTQKRINTVQPIIERLRKLYANGISVAAGLIIGFDTDKPVPTSRWWSSFRKAASCWRWLGC